MRNYIFIIISLILFGAAAPAMAEDKGQPAEPPVITDEDKEIAEVIEMIEMMEMLKNMELIKDYDLFAEEETDEKEN